MALFDGSLAGASPAHREVFSRYEKIYTIIDFLAAVFFIVGSVFFFYESLTYAGTWLFVIGSVLFAASPTVKLLREFHLARLPIPGEGHTVSPKPDR